MNINKSVTFEGKRYLSIATADNRRPIQHNALQILTSSAFLIIHYDEEHNDLSSA